MVGPHDLLASPPFEHTFRGQNPPREASRRTVGDPLFRAHLSGLKSSPENKPAQGRFASLYCGVLEGPKKRTGDGPEKGRDRGPPCGPCNRKSWEWRPAGLLRLERQSRQGPRRRGEQVEKNALVNGRSPRPVGVPPFEHTFRGQNSPREASPRTVGFHLFPGKVAAIFRPPKYKARIVPQIEYKSKPSRTPTTTSVAQQPIMADIALNRDVRHRFLSSHPCSW